VAGRVDYETHGKGYAAGRRADPRIAAAILAALGDARSVLNVGAGAGSYEPADRWVLAVEPSATMRAQRPADAAPALACAAESLPFDDDSVDAAMASVTIHQWQLDYLAEPMAIERPRFGTVEEVADELGGATRIETIPTPADCTEGFFEAFWNRPEAILDPTVRASRSIWQLVEPEIQERIVALLGADLESGRWDEEHGALREQESYEGSLRLVISEPV
jgi:Methyltransferase domain